MKFDETPLKGAYLISLEKIAVDIMEFVNDRNT